MTDEGATLMSNRDNDIPDVVDPVLQTDDLHTVAESTTSSSRGTDRPAIDRDALIESWRRAFGTVTMDEEIRPLVGSLRALADHAVALAGTASGIMLTTEESNRAWDWAMRLQEKSGGLSPEDRALADRLQSDVLSGNFGPTFDVRD